MKYTGCTIPTLAMYMKKCHSAMTSLWVVIETKHLLKLSSIIETHSIMLSLDPFLPIFSFFFFFLLFAFFLEMPTVLCFERLAETHCVPKILLAVLERILSENENSDSYILSYKLSFILFLSFCRIMEIWYYYGRIQK